MPRYQELDLERYAEQDPAAVARELAAEAELTGAASAALQPRPADPMGTARGRQRFHRGFPGLYFLHYALYHLWDVRSRS